MLALLMITHMLWHHQVMQLPLPSHSPLSLVTSATDRKVLVVIKMPSIISLVLSKLLLLLLLLLLLKRPKMMDNMVQERID